MGKLKRKPKHKKTKKAQNDRAQEIATALFMAGDDYVLACAEAIFRAKDGSSRRVIDMMQKALDYQRRVRELFAILDPKHYSREAKDK